MKTISILIIGALVIAVCGTTSCKKCLCCAPVVGYITCIKGADTIKPFVEGSVFIVNDTINFYTNLGYTCTDMTGPVFLDIFQTCGVLKIKQQQQMGNRCQGDATLDDGYCGN